MEPKVVRNYLEQVRRLEFTWNMLRNNKEGKNISKENDVGVIKPILGDDYLNMLPKYD